MRYRIFMTGSGIAEEAQQFLRENDCELATGEPQDSPEVIAEKLAQFEPHALIVRQGKILPNVQSASTNLKVICKHGVGLDNIDIEAASQLGIPVMFTPGANFEAVAEHTLALILAATRKIPQENQRVKNGIFDKKQYGGLELKGKTLGIVGYGSIAKQLIALLAPFKLNVLMYRRSAQEEDLPAYVRQAKTMDEVLFESDIISLHCPLTAETTGLINKESINKMKSGVYIINTARGAIINEADLVKALKTGRIAGAALDTLEVEPPAVDNPLYELENVILSPHIAGSSDHSAKNMGLGAAMNVLSVLRGEAINMTAVKNPEVFSA